MQGHIKMTNFSEELLEKAKQTKSVEELLALAGENNMEMTEDEAKAYFAKLNSAPGELSDEELDNVAGGGCGGGEGGLREEDLPAGTHVTLSGVNRCWNIPDTDNRVIEIGKVRDGCNATYFKVSNFNVRYESVRLRCPDCGRLLSVPYSQIQKI